MGSTKTGRWPQVGTQAGLLGGLFFVGYFIFQVPVGTFAERRSVRTLVFDSLVAWGRQRRCSAS